MNILVTGCNGQLGYEMQLLSKHNTQHVYFFTDIAELNITDERAVDMYISTNEIDCVVNCAAYTAVDKAEENAEFCNMLNNIAPGYLAKAVEKRNGSIIQISTDYVFDGTSHVPYTEDAPTCPNSVYGRTKLAGEESVMQNCAKSMIIRTSWLYSIYGNNFVKTMIRLGKERESLGVIFDQVGTPTNAHDLAAGIFVAINNGIVPGIYHFSNEGAISWYDFTKSIHRISGIESCKVRPLHTNEYPTLAARPHYSVLDKTKFKQTYGVEIPYWEDSLRECIEKLN